MDAAGPKTAKFSSSEVAGAVERFTAAAEALWLKLKAPGMTAAFVLPDGEVNRVALGIADADSSVRMPLDARMLGGSTGKSIFAATALVLAARRVVELDAPLAQYLGHTPWFSRLPNAQQLTLRHLLSHAGGVGDHMGHPNILEHLTAMRKLKGPNAYLRPVEAIEYVLDAPPMFPPGESFFYTDTGYIIAGLALEAATGQSLYELARTHVMDRFRLTNIEPQVARAFENLVPGHTNAPEGSPLPRKTIGDDGLLAYNPAGEWAGGGFVSSSSDLARFVWTYASGRMIESAYLKDALRIVRYSWVPGQFGGYGIGLFASNSPLGPAYGHGGYYPGYRSQMTYFPDQDIAVAFQVNSSEHFGGYQGIVSSRAEAAKLRIAVNTELSIVSDGASSLASAVTRES